MRVAAPAPPRGAYARGHCAAPPVTANMAAHRRPLDTGRARPHRPCVLRLSSASGRRSAGRQALSRSRRPCCSGKPAKGHVTRRPQRRKTAVRFEQAAATIAAGQHQRAATNSNGGVRGEGGAFVLWPRSLSDRFAMAATSRRPEPRARTQCVRRVFAVFAVDAGGRPSYVSVWPLCTTHDLPFFSSRVGLHPFCPLSALCAPAKLERARPRKERSNKNPLLHLCSSDREPRRPYIPTPDST